MFLHRGGLSDGSQNQLTICPQISELPAKPMCAALTPKRALATSGLRVRILVPPLNLIVPL